MKFNLIRAAGSLLNDAPSSKIRRSTFIRTLAALPAAALSLPSGAQSYPSRPITLVIPYPPGGSTDTSARLVTDGVSQILGQPFVMVYRPGASSIIGAESVKGAPKDGYTLLLATTITFSVNPIQFGDKLKYRLEDFVTLGSIARVAYGLVVSNKVPANNLQEFIAWARAKPDGFTYGTTGQGTAPHIGGAMVARAINAKGVAVHYKGSAQVQTDLLSGVLDMAWDPITGSIQNHKAGKLKIIAVIEQARWPELPDVPTIAEVGYKSLEMTGYIGIVAPAGIPPAAAASLSQAIADVVASPSLATRYTQLGLVPVVTKGDDFARLLQTQEGWWRKTIEDNQISFNQ